MAAMIPTDKTKKEEQVARQIAGQVRAVGAAMQRAYTRINELVHKNPGFKTADKVPQFDPPTVLAAFAANNKIKMTSAELLALQADLKAIINKYNDVKIV